MADDMEVFRQVDYLWLFNAELKFDERPKFTLEDSSIEQRDYEVMHRLNRQTLTTFLKSRSDDQAMDECDEPAEAIESAWADENLDEEIKELLNHY